MNKFTKLAGAAGVATLVAISGTAFTASQTVAASVAGYGTSTVSGATAKSVVYTLSADSTQINKADIVFEGDQSKRTVKAGFGTGASTACTVGAYDSVAVTTPVACSGFTASTADSTSFNVAVS